LSIATGRVLRRGAEGKKKKKKPAEVLRKRDSSSAAAERRGHFDLVVESRKEGKRKITTPWISSRRKRTRDSISWLGMLFSLAGRELLILPIGESGGLGVVIPITVYGKRLPPPEEKVRDLGEDRGSSKSRRLLLI